MPLPAVNGRCDRSCWRGRCRAGIDFSGWPIARIHAGEPTNEELDERMHAMDEMLARRQPFACVMLMNTSAKFNNQHRKRITQWNTDNAEQLRLYCRGMAFVFPESPVIRFVISSMLILIRRPVAHRVFDTEGEAMAWTQQRMREPA
jgi:hypothetical protein